MITLYNIEEFEDIISKSNNDRQYMSIRLNGCYGDPVEFGYQTVYVYEITYKGNKYNLEIEENLNELCQRIHFERVNIRGDKNEATGNEYI